MKLFSLLTMIGATMAMTYDFIPVCNYGGRCDVYNCHDPLCTLIAREYVLEHMVAEELCLGEGMNDSEYSKCTGSECYVVGHRHAVGLQQEAELRMRDELRLRDYTEYGEGSSDDCLESGEECGSAFNKCCNNMCTPDRGQAKLTCQSKDRPR